MGTTASPRTIVRDTIMAVLASRNDKDSVRVSAFALSKTSTNQKTITGNTYCVSVTDEERTPQSYGDHNWTMEIKVVCYSNDQDDPRGIMDGMIEDLTDAMAIVNTHADLKDVAWRLLPMSITTDEQTTDAGTFVRAVCVWTMDHNRF